MSLLLNLLIDAFLQPPVWLFAVALSLLAVRHRITSRVRRWAATAWLAAAYLIHCPFLLHTARVHWEYQFLPLQAHNLDTALPYHVVVLGAGVGFDRDLPARLRLQSEEKLRWDEGLYWAQRLPHSQLFVSGPRPRPNYPAQGEEALRAALDANFPPHRAVALITGTNTWGELQAYATWARTQSSKQPPKQQPTPLVLVTSALHLPRAVQQARALGLNPIPAPATYTSYRHQPLRWDAFVPHPRIGVQWSALLHEWVGWMRTSTYASPTHRKIVRAVLELP